MLFQELKQSFSIKYNYAVLFDEHVFSTNNGLLEDVITRSNQGIHRVTIAIDTGVVESYPEILSQIKTYFKSRSKHILLTGEPLLVKGGEVCKTAPLEVKQLYDVVADQSICRHSFVLAIGGGAMLDAIGFAAATAHRGVKLIRMPTTVLAQNDAGVGVKNAINHSNRKNFVGTFAPPYAVINDYALLSTLEDRDKRSGIAEAVKVALIKDKNFFEYLYTHRGKLAQFDDQAMQYMIYHCAKLHLQHIANNGDPFEQGSARPLDFGHWVAHKLEELTHTAVRHGEAVALGIMLDSLYSWRVGNIDAGEMEKVFDLLFALGFDVYHYEIENLDLECALQEFREHLGGRLCITLLEAIGKGKEYSVIDISLMQACVTDLKKLQLNQKKQVFISSEVQLQLPLVG